MRVTLFGTRGSIPAPGPETARYGGNTASVEVRGDDGTLLVLDAGTGIRRLGAQLPPDLVRVDILLTHLHMDHIQGLGFFGPLYRADVEVHIWMPGCHAICRRRCSPCICAICPASPVTRCRGRRSRSVRSAFKRRSCATRTRPWAIVSKRTVTAPSTCPTTSPRSASRATDGSSRIGPRATR